MAKADTIGSWYNSGYHGHFRSKSRNDFICEYRQLAKPQPPKVFYKRTQQPVSGHIFSKHDNRHSFMNDALYFEQGLGRKRIQTKNTNRFNEDLLTWMPQKQEVHRGGAKKSMYKIDYRGVAQQRLAEQLIQRPKTSFDDDCLPITTYRYAHGDENPNRHLISAMSNDGFNSSTSTRIKKFPGTRETVASCLSWQGNSSAKNRPTIPAATQVSVPEPASQTKLAQTAPADPALPQSVPCQPHSQTTIAAL